jgi:hypothetical protein
MKWLFLLLLIINVGIFAWGYQQEHIQRQPVLEAGVDVGNMRLISEVPDTDKQENIPITDEVVSETVVAAAEESNPGQTAEQTTEHTDTTATETVAKAETEVKATPDKEKEQEKVAATEKTAQKQEQKKPATTDSETVRRCGTIGPINDRQVAKEIEEDLKKSNLNARLERSIEKEQIGYWVIIPPLADGSQAQAKIEELAQIGLKDIWHFRGGGMKNAISLGMFAQKENAEKFSKEVLQKGFKTEMQPRFINKTRYVVKFRIDLTKTAADIMWRTVERKYSKNPFSEQTCEPIATE